MSDTLTHTPNIIDAIVANYYGADGEDFRRETEHLDWFQKDMKALETARIKHESAERVAKIRKGLSHGAFGEGAWA
jgi:hypothetical protein